MSSRDPRVQTPTIDLDGLAPGPQMAEIASRLEERVDRTPLGAQRMRALDAARCLRMAAQAAQEWNAAEFCRRTHGAEEHLLAAADRVATTDDRAACLAWMRHVRQAHVHVASGGGLAPGR